MGWWKESIDIVKKNDPAARTSLEVLLTYPGFKSLGCSSYLTFSLAPPLSTLSAYA